jgi:hypothetical protein
MDVGTATFASSGKNFGDESTQRAQEAASNDLLEEPMSLTVPVLFYLMLEPRLFYYSITPPASS